MEPSSDLEQHIGENIYELDQDLNNIVMLIE